MRNLLPYLFIFCLYSVTAVGAEYYTWVDENGVTNYSQTKPPGYDARHVARKQGFGEQIIDDPPDESPAETNTSRAPSDATAADNANTRERQALIAKIADTKRSNCEIGRRNLIKLEAFRRIRVSDDQGENRVISDAEKAAKIARAQQIIRENCSG